MAWGAVSCGSDSDDDMGGDNPMDPPQFESSSALYKVTDTDSNYKSVEFTASGNYIITTRGNVQAPATRSYGADGNVLFGTYIKNDDTFVLDGFGTIVVNGRGSDTVSLVIKTNSGEMVTVEARLWRQYRSSGKTDMLCRTWKLDKIWLYSKMQGQVLIDQYYDNYREFLKAVYDMEGEKYTEKDLDIVQAWEPVQVIFTKSGSYIVFYVDGTLSACYWKWQDESIGELCYSWNYETLDDPTKSGVINIDFGDSQLLITEYFFIDYQSANNVAYAQYIMSEVK